jgi:hypothetical protein
MTGRRHRRVGRPRQRAFRLGERRRAVEVERLARGIFARMRHRAFPRTAR